MLPLPAVAVELDLSADQYTAYQALWAQADTHGHHLPAAIAVNFFNSSRLSRPVLCELLAAGPAVMKGGVAGSC